MRGNHKAVLAGMCAGIALVVPMHAASAQTVDASAEPPETTTGMADIVVTATRTEQKLQDVPVAVSAFSGATLEKAGVRRIDDLTANVPSLFLTPIAGSVTGAQIFVRGLGEPDPFPTTDIPVGIYVDDVYIPRLQGGLLEILDVARVEVLRGPQGTLFGKNTTGGAIQIVTRDPPREFAGRVGVTVGNYNRIDVRGSFGGPIIGDVLTASVGAFRRRRDGWMTLVNQNRRVNDQDIYGFQGSLRFAPTSDFVWRISADYTRTRGTPQYGINVIGVGTQPSNVRGDADGDTFTTVSDLPEGEENIRNRSYGVASHIVWDLAPQMKLKSVTSFRRLFDAATVDFDGGSTAPLPPVFHFDLDLAQRQFSQELQLSGSRGKLEWLIGGFYFDEKFTQRTDQTLFAVIGTQPVNVTSQRGTSYAAFGSATWEVVDGLRLTAGLRWSRDEKRLTQQVFNADGSPAVACRAPDGSYVTFPPPAIAPGKPVPCAALPPVVIPFGPPGAPVYFPPPPGSINVLQRFDRRADTEQLSPRFVIAYKPSETISTYVSASRGYRSAAFDGRATDPNLLAQLAIIPPEKVWSYEGGVKVTAFDRKLSVNVAAYRAEITGLQRTTFISGLGFTKISLGDVRSTGLEVEALARPLAGVELSATLDASSAKFRRLNFAIASFCPYTPAATLGDFDLPNSPNFRGRGGASYGHRVAGGTLTLSGSASHQSSFQSDICPYASTRAPARTLVDGSLRWESDGGGWLASVSVRNALNSRYFNTALQFPPGPQGQPPSVGYFVGEPRMVEASLRYRF